MVKRRLRAEQGMTLIEVTIAVAIFAAVIAATASSIADFYVGVDLQKQRIEAANSCRGVLSYLREQRANTSSDFPAALLAIIADKQEDGWAEFLKSGAAQGLGLDSHTITVTCTSLDGAAVSDDDNPIRVIVRSTWNDRKGRQLKAEVATCFTDQ